MDKIKESFDSLPVGVCFFDNNGVVRLINHRMLAVADNLSKNGIQTVFELENILSNPPKEIVCLNPLLKIFRFRDGTVLRFTKETIFTKSKNKYTQVTATDVTEIINRQSRLEDENQKLTEANERMRKLLEQMPEIIREEETLAMKLRVHDDIGHSILAARRALLRNANLTEMRETASLWEDSINVLYRSNQIIENSDPIEKSVSRAAEMGVSVIFEGSRPHSGKACSLVASAIRECSANCARHAGGTMLFVSFAQNKGLTEISITNNGTAPKTEIREGGGLSMLRQRIEENGGYMKITSLPEFKLTLRLFEKEEPK